MYVFIDLYVSRLMFFCSLLPPNIYSKYCILHTIFSIFNFTYHCTVLPTHRCTYNIKRVPITVTLDIAFYEQKEVIIDNFLHIIVCVYVCDVRLYVMRDFSIIF